MQFEDLPQLPGIYIIKNKITGKVHVGYSVNMKKRMFSHLYLLNKQFWIDKYNLIANGYNVKNPDVESGKQVSCEDDDFVTLSGSIPYEMFFVALEIWGSKGMTKADGLRDVASQYVTHQGNLQLVERSQQQKADLYGVTKIEVRSKVFGAYKRRSREFKSRYQTGTEK